MSDVIEPSEIIVEQESAPKTDPVHVNPWIRFIARFFDYSWFFLLLWTTRRLFGGQFPFGKMEALVPFEFFVWIPFEAIFLKLWGTTPGKFLLGTHLKRKGKIDYIIALRRSLSVWFRGLGMWIPVVNFICLSVAYNRLKIFKTTSWDRDDRIEVIHTPIQKWRLIFAIVFAFIGLLFYYTNKKIL